MWVPVGSGVSVAVGVLVFVGSGVFVAVGVFVRVLVAVGVFVLVGTGVFVLVGCGVSVAWAAPSVPSKQSPGFVRTGLQLITSETRSSKMFTSTSVSAVEPPL